MLLCVLISVNLRQFFCTILELPSPHEGKTRKCLEINDSIISIIYSIHPFKGPCGPRPPTQSLASLSRVCKNLWEGSLQIPGKADSQTYSQNLRTHSIIRLALRNIIWAFTVKLELFWYFTFLGFPWPRSWPHAPKIAKGPDPGPGPMPFVGPGA